MSINISPIIIILDVGHQLDPDHHKEILNEYTHSYVKQETY